MMMMVVVVMIMIIIFYPRSKVSSQWLSTHTHTIRPTLPLHLSSTLSSRLRDGHQCADQLPPLEHAHSGMAREIYLQPNRSDRRGRSGICRWIPASSLWLSSSSPSSLRHHRIHHHNHRSIVILDLLHFVYLARPLSWFLRYVLDPPIAH